MHKICQQLFKQSKFHFSLPWNRYRYYRSRLVRWCWLLPIHFTAIVPNKSSPLLVNISGSQTAAL